MPGVVRTGSQVRYLTISQVAAKSAAEHLLAEAQREERGEPTQRKPLVEPNPDEQPWTGVSIANVTR
jgi:hypothetical protein